jgi:carbon monoxide dehydrogenase subunit G
MAKGFTVTETIERPIDEVWGFLSDWKSMPSWMKGVDTIGPAGDGPIGEGTRVTFTARGAERESTIAAWEPPRVMTLVSTQGGMTATYEYSCAEVEGGTEVTLHAECVARGFMWKAMSPLIGYMMKRTDSPQLSALKREMTSS